MEYSTPTQIFGSPTTPSHSTKGHILYQQYECSSNESASAWYQPTLTDCLRAFCIGSIGLAILIGNIISITVFNTKPYSKIFDQRPRSFLTSLACTDLCIGVVFVPFCIYPALYHCWPLGQTFCQIQALFIGALFHESTLSLVCVAVDRFIYIQFPLQYDVYFTVSLCQKLIIGTWFTSFLFYGVVIFVFNQFYYDDIGVTCEPYYENDGIIIGVVAVFYVPPLVTMLVIYGQIYRISYLHSRRIDVTGQVS